MGLGIQWELKVVKKHKPQAAQSIMLLCPLLLDLKMEM